MPVSGATPLLRSPCSPAPPLLTRLTLGKLQSPRWRAWCNLCSSSQSLVSPGSCAGYRGLRGCARVWPLRGPCPTGAADASGKVGSDMDIYHIQESAPIRDCQPHRGQGPATPASAPQGFISPGVGCRGPRVIHSQRQLSPFKMSGFCLALLKISTVPPEGLVKWEILSPALSGDVNPPPSPAPCLAGS